MSRRRWGDPLAKNPNRRQAQVSDLLRRQIGMILELEFSDQLPALTTVTEVRLTNDLRHARVFVSVLGTSEQQEQCIKLLQNSRQNLRQLLARQVILKYLPTLEFLPDLTAERAQRIDELLYGDERTTEPN